MIAAKNLEESVAHVIDTARNITNRVAQLEHEQETCLNRLRGQPGVKGTTLDQAVHAMCAELMRLRNDQKLCGELVAVLSKHCGESGQSEGAVETLERIIAERAVLYENGQRIGAEHGEAWKIIAAMHEAAVGEKRAPEGGLTAETYERDVRDALANGRAALQLRDEVCKALDAAAVDWKRLGTDGSMAEDVCSTIERVRHLITERDEAKKRTAELEAIIRNPKLELCRSCARNPCDCDEARVVHDVGGHVVQCVLFVSNADPEAEQKVLVKAGPSRLTASERRRLEQFDAMVQLLSPYSKPGAVELASVVLTRVLSEACDLRAKARALEEELHPLRVAEADRSEEVEGRARACSDCPDRHAIAVLHQAIVRRERRG